MREISIFGQVIGWILVGIGALVAFGVSMPVGIATALSGLAYVLLAAILRALIMVIDEMRLARAEAMQRAGWVPVQDRTHG